MAATPDLQKKDEELTLSERLYDFLQKNRRNLFIGLMAIIAVLIGLVVFTTVRDKFRANALSKVDAFNRRFESLKAFIASEEPADIARQTEIAVLLVELDGFESKNSGFAAARAYCISAEIYAGQKKWAEAEDKWAKAAKAAAQSYLEPICIFNAGAAAEEQGNLEPAINYYQQALTFGKIFPSAANAQFSVGRLEEERNNREAALEAYRNILSRWPKDPVWSNLAQNRILLLSD
jgi:tetratricopeptide (TPR) repeat protein